MRRALALLVSVIALSWAIAVAEDKPDVAAAVAKIEAIGGGIQRENDQPDGAIVTVGLVDSEALKDDDLAFLKSLPNVRQLYLGRTSTSDAGLKHIAGLKELKVLGLIGTRVTDAGLKELAGLQKLESLYLAQTAITDGGLNELSKLKGLKELRLLGTKTTDAGVKQLEKAIPGLRTVTGAFAADRSRRQSGVLPGDKPEFAEAITRVEALDGQVTCADDSADASVITVRLIGSVKLKDDDLSHLKSFPGLQELYLDNTEISDAGLKHVAGLKELRELSLVGTRITDAGLKELVGLQNLECLLLVQTVITDDGLKELVKLKGLKEVHLQGTKTTDAGVKQIEEPLAARSQEAYLRLAGKKAGQKRNDNGLKMEFVWCLPGSFRMGKETQATAVVIQENKADDAEAADDEPVRQTTILRKIPPVEVYFYRGFWLGRTEVTQAEWKGIMESEPWKEERLTRQGDDFPAACMTWNDAMTFCRKLTDQERKTGRLSDDWEYTLPTEAQWERACRARSDTKFSFGDEASKLGDYGYYCENTLFNTDEQNVRQVGQKEPNRWGLYDMHGNVWEWCRDVFHPQLPGGVAPEVKSGSQYRVIRGGSWVNTAELCESAYRTTCTPQSRHHYLGFRMALVSTASR